MNGRKIKWRRCAAFLWVWLLAVGLILGGCGAGGSEGNGADQPAGEEISGAYAAGWDGDEAEGADEGSDGGNTVQGERTEQPAEAESGEAGAAGTDGTLFEDNKPESGQTSAVGLDETVFGDRRLESSEESPTGSEETVSGDGGSAAGTDIGDKDSLTVEYGGEYSDPEHVALYIHIYGELPPNYITKSEARDLGWDSGEGNLWDVAPGMSIGGDSFGNREGNLPEKKGRTYYECDVNYAGGYRGGERIVFSSDGLVYYSQDHYENFELLYDAEGRME